MARKSRSTRPPEGYKFAGAALGDGAAFTHAAQIVKNSGGPLAVVCSAPAGVTDLLLDVAEKARLGEAVKVKAALATLGEKFGGIVRALAMPARVRDELHA